MKKVIAVFPAQEKLKELMGYIGRGVEKIEVDGYSVKTTSHRYPVFNKNCKCVWCGAPGVEMRLEVSDGNPNAAHFNLYTADGRLMTKDHIVAASNGGSNSHNNYQTMCMKCNNRKATFKAPESRLRNKNLLYSSMEKIEQLSLIKNPSVRGKLRVTYHGAGKVNA